MDEKKSQSEYLYDILYTIFKSKYLFLIIFLTTFGGIIFGTYLVTPLWQATARIRVQYNPKQQLTMFETVTTPGAVVSGINPANDVIQLLTSRELAEKVALKFQRDKLWEIRTNAPETTREIIRWHINDFLIGNIVRFLQYLGILTDQPDNYLAMAVEELQEDLEEIDLEEDTTIVMASLWAESPERATAITNYLVELLLEKNREISEAPVNRSISATKEQLSKAERDLGEIQERLRKFKEESKLVLYNEEANILLQRLDKYESELNSMESQMASLKVEKSEDHPAAKSLQARINEYKDIYMPQIKKDLMSLPLKEVEVTKLTQELKVREGLYTTLKQKVLELEVLKNSPLGDVELKVIDPAKVYLYVKPDWPRWVVNIPLGIIGSVITGLFFIFFTEYWNNSFKSVKELEENILTPVLGAIPRFSFFSKKTLLDSLANVTSGNYKRSLPLKLIEQRNIKFIDQYSHVADAILLKSNTSGGNLFLITSPGPGEGKSTVATILGQILSLRNKRVLLIDANLRAPSLEDIMHTNENRGLLDYFAGRSGLEDIIVNAKGMDVIFAGAQSFTKNIDPFEVISSAKMEILLKDVKTKYDFIFIDSPCIKKFKDPLVLSALSDGVILAVEANRTPKRAILMSLDKVKALDGQVKGIILNKRADYVPEVLQNLLF